MTLPGKELKPYLNKKTGYLCVTLSKNGKETGFPIHRLVLEAFIGPCPPGMECRHFPDRTKTNNRLSNLQWGTVKENAEDRIIHGTTKNRKDYSTVPRGETHPFAKLSDADVETIRKEMAENPYRGQGRALAKRFHVSEATICDIRYNRIRKG